MSIGTKLAFYGRAFLSMHITRKSELNYMPEYVALEVTNVCNFKCVFCPQSDPQHHLKVPKTYLDEQLCELYLSKIRAAGIKTNLMHWTLDGEPFMHKGFARLVDVSANYGFTNTYFATNGMLCTIERLLEFPLDRVRLNLAIDFCANKVYFEQVRGTKDSWDRVRENIVTILADPRMQNVRIVLTDISSFLEHDPASLNQQFAALRELFGVRERIIYLTRTFHNATGFLESRSKSMDKRYNLCPYPWTHLRIASNGDIVPCCRDLQHKTVVGNLKTDSIQEIWNSRLMQDVRFNLLLKAPERIAACKGCDLPYDDSKFTLKNIYRAARGRMQLFAR